MLGINLLMILYKSVLSPVARAPALSKVKWLPYQNKIHKNLNPKQNISGNNLFMIFYKYEKKKKN